MWSTPKYSGGKRSWTLIYDCTQRRNGKRKQFFGWRRRRNNLIYCLQLHVIKIYINSNSYAHHKASLLWMEEGNSAPLRLTLEISFHEKWTSKSGWISINKLRWSCRGLLSAHKVASSVRSFEYDDCRSSPLFRRKIVVRYINCHEFEDLMSKIMAHIFPFRHIGFECDIFFQFVVYYHTRELYPFCDHYCGAFILSTQKSERERRVNPIKEISYCSTTRQHTAGE